MNTTIANPDALILVEIPHQMPATVYSFKDRTDALKRITAHHVSNDYQWVRHASAADWDAYIHDCFGQSWAEDEQASAWHAKGSALFEAGAKAIIERSSFGHEELEVVDEASAGDELEWAFDDLRHDLHAAHLLNHDEALERLASGTGTHHQSIRWHQLLREEAERLEWIEVPAAKEKEEAAE